MLLGIFGGSFDPVHNAHLDLARACQSQAALDEVWFTPAAVQPLKQAGPRAADSQRLEMLRLAVEGEPAWQLCTLELDRGGVSYTVDTLRAIHKERPGDELFFLLGNDTLIDVPRWRQPEEICRLATPLVVCRPGQHVLNLGVFTTICSKEHQPRLIEMQPSDTSSREIRRRIAAGESIDELVPPAVAQYIKQNKLYR